ncbi:hypothetical protein QUF70_06900 [Desulfobacterales bacterium HSG17]|nr:hypothetical protein [Desulfobacterales bacterium HSG17]
MIGYLPNKDLIFFNPSNSGVVFTHPAKRYITVEQLLKTQECLVQKTTSPVIYIEDRRVNARRKNGYKKAFTHGT